MKAKFRTAMTSSIFEVLETMFFLAMEERGEDNWDRNAFYRDENPLVCRLRFHGQFAGLFMLAIPEDLLLTMTENFVGQERSELTQDHLEGTILEVINMIAGNTFSRFDDKAELKLAIPEIVSKDSMIRPDPDVFQILLETEAGYIDVQAVIEN